MARVKKKSSVKLEVAGTRAAGLESIGSDLDLGNGLTLVAYKAAIVDANAKLGAYNTLLSQVGSAP